MKTTVNQILEHLEDIEDAVQKMSLPSGASLVIKSAIKTLQETIKNEYIEKEKQMIIDSYLEGAKEQRKYVVLNASKHEASDYYKKTFNP